MASVKGLVPDRVRAGRALSVIERDSLSNSTLAANLTANAANLRFLRLLILDNSAVAQHAAWGIRYNKSEGDKGVSISTQGAPTNKIPTRRRKYSGL